MSVTSFKKRDRSKLDEVQQRREAYLAEENAAGVIHLNTFVPARFTRVAMEYDGSNNMTKVTYYDDNCQEQTEIRTVADVSGSLNNTYFIMYSARDQTLYHVWYNVSAGGTDPAPVGSAAIEVAISTNDPSAVISLATQQVLDAHVDFNAVIDPTGSNRMLVTNEVGGSTTNTADFDSGFSFLNLSEGANRIVATLVLTYDGNNNLTSCYKTTEIIE